MVPPPRLRRMRLTLVAIVVLVGAQVWLAARPASETEPAASTAPAHPESTVPLADVAPWGANFFLEREVDPWVRRRTVQMAHEAGIRWAKQQFVWAYIEKEDGVFDWSSYDDIVDLFLANDIDVIARLDWPPDWVTKPEWVPESYRQRQNVPPADVSQYARFVAATVDHFRGRVRFFQVWNEPNLIGEWGFNPAHPVDPKEYVALLKAAAEAARRVDPNVVILSAPLAFTTETVDVAGNMSDLAYLDGMYKAGAGDYFDVLGANAFGMDQPPQAAPGSGVLNFRRVELERAVMEKYGDGRKPVWLDEYGWNAAPADARDAVWQRVAETEQASWTVDGVHWAALHWPWLGVMNVWYFRQWGGLAPDRAVYYFRMVDVDFTPRRLYAAVQADAATESVAGPGVWAERSAPVQLPSDPAERARWQWVWSDGARDGSALESAEPGASLTFKFVGRDLELRVLEGPQAGSVRVDVDGHRVPSPDRQAVWPLAAASAQWQWLPVAEGLAPGTHELALTVGTAGGTVAVDSFLVGSGESKGDGTGAARLALAAATLGCVALLGVDTRRALARIAP